MRPWSVFALWGALLAAIALAGALFFRFPDPAEPLLFAGSVATMAVLAALVRRRPGRAAPLWPRPDVSLPVPWLGVAIALAAYGLEVGWWLCLIGGAMLVAGVVALVRERRAERAALARGRQQAAWEGRLRW